MPQSWDPQDPSFVRWWEEDGRFIDPDTSDVSWFDKRQSLCEMAFAAGLKTGMARGGNYTADDAVNPIKITFANGRRVRCVNGRLVLEQ
jgi:hypothetical protein